MPSQISPGILTNEVDLTTIVPAVSTTEGALGGVFRWGPLEQRVLVSSEDLLVTRFGSPSNFNPETWFTAASFLAYGSRLFVARAGDTTGNNFTRSHSGNSTNLAIESNTAILKLSDTTNLSIGMVLFYSNTASLPVGAKVTAVNSTTITLDDSATANVDSAEVILREDILYTAVGQQSDLSYDETDVSDWDAQIVKNDDHYVGRVANGETFDVSVLYAARYPGEMGNSLRVSVCDTSAQYKSNTAIAVNAHINSTASVMTGVVGSNTLTVSVQSANTANTTEVATATAHVNTLYQSLSVGDLVEVGNSSAGLQFLKVTAKTAIVNTDNVFTFTIQGDDEVKVSANTSNSRLVRYWEFYNSVDRAPGQSIHVLQFGNTSAQDELHAVVVDQDGKFSGSPGTILEVYKNLSRASDAKSADGATIYYKDVINQRSQYIWWGNHRTTAPGNTSNYITTSTASVPLSMNFIGGADGPNEANVALAHLASAYDLFASREDIDISLVLQGKARGESASHYTQLANYIIDNICETRKDCVAFISPDYNDVVNNRYDEAADIEAFVGVLRDTSYGVLDSGYKYMYDRYNDLYRWVPLNGDIAGLCVRTDAAVDAWYSPAGFNRGQIKNIIRLAYNPKQAERDTLYKNGCNPVVSFPGRGTVLYGDKTLLKKPSAFDRINVRRLFIVLRKAISKASESTLFEFNDEFTRAQFKNLIVPYLRDVQGRRGITDFVVVCDGTNNTAEVIDRNEFIGDIYIKPARSINYITLNFVGVRTGIAFSEVIGRF